MQSNHLKFILLAICGSLLTRRCRPIFLTLDKELFEVVETVVKDSGGRQLFIRTSTKVVQYLREKGYVLELAVGKTVFDKRIEFVAGQYVYSKDMQ